MIMCARLPAQPLHGLSGRHRLTGRLGLRQHHQCSPPCSLSHQAPCKHLVKVSIRAVDMQMNEIQCKL